MGALTLPLEIQKVYVTYAQQPNQWGNSAKHTTEYIRVKSPKELTEAVEQAMEELVQAQAGEIQYYLDE